jgi:branched-chain amino acid aminotransferase
VYVHVDGELVPAREAGVGVRDGGLVEGDAAAVRARSYGGRVFRWDGVAERLLAAARAHDLEPPPADDLRARIGATLDANDLADARVRLSVTRGAGRGPGVVVVADPLPRGGRSDRTAYAGPADLITADARRIPPAAVPLARYTHNRLDRARASREAARAGVDGALVRDLAGAVVGAADADLLFVAGDSLRTPRLDEPGGVVRDALLDLAVDEGIPVARGEFEPAEVRAADEAFLANPTYGVRPVSSIDGTDVGGGPVTTLLARLFDGLVEREYYGDPTADTDGDPPGRDA